MRILKGLVTEVDGAAAAVKVRIPEYDVETDWLPVLQAVTLGAMAFLLPRVGSQVVVAPGLGLDDAVILGCLYSQVDPPPATSAAILALKADDGTLLQYDPGAHELRIEGPHLLKVTVQRGEISGDLKLTGDLEIQGDVKLTGKLDQTGDLEVTGKIHATTSILTDGPNSAHHTHPVSGGVAQAVP